MTVNSGLRNNRPALRSGHSPFCFAPPLFAIGDGKFRFSPKGSGRTVQGNGLGIGNKPALKHPEGVRQRAIVYEALDGNSRC